MTAYISAAKLVHMQIGVDFALKVINWDQQTIVRLQLWDIGACIFRVQTSAGKAAPARHGKLLNSDL